MSGLFYNLGRKLGQKAVPTVRKARWLYDSFAGDEEEALRAEAALGAELAGELRKVVDLTTDPEMGAWVEGVCGRLAGRVQDKRRRFSVEIFHDAFPGAIALPGGYLFLSDSLVRLSDGHAEDMAFAIGHEIGHVVLGHARDRVLESAMWRVASAATAQARGPVVEWLRREGTVALQNSHARESELEADKFGLRLAVAAGFPGEGAITFLREVEHWEATGRARGRYLESHPAASLRIGRLWAFLRQLPPSTPTATG